MSTHVKKILLIVDNSLCTSHVGVCSFVSCTSWYMSFVEKGFTPKMKVKNTCSSFCDIAVG